MNHDSRSLAHSCNGASSLFSWSSLHRSSPPSISLLMSSCIGATHARVKSLLKPKGWCPTWKVISIYFLNCLWMLFSVAILDLSCTLSRVPLATLCVVSPTSSFFKRSLCFRVPARNHRLRNDNGYKKGFCFSVSVRMRSQVSYVALIHVEQSLVELLLLQLSPLRYNKNGCHCAQPPFFLFSCWGNMGLITGVIAFFYHLPQIYKWLFKPYYILSILMSSAFLILRKCPGLCENLYTEREDGNPCDFDWVSIG